LDLSPIEQRYFISRNLDRLYSAYVRADPVLRIRVLALHRKQPKSRFEAHIRYAARNSLRETLGRDPSTAGYTSLLEAFVLPLNQISEVHSASKPLFRSFKRAPEYCAIKFPLRDARPRFESGRMKKSPFSSHEVGLLDFLVEAQPIYFRCYYQISLILARTPICASWTWRQSTSQREVAQIYRQSKHNFPVFVVLLLRSPLD